MSEKHKERAKLLLLRKKIALTEAPYLVINRLGGLYDDAFMLVFEAVQDGRLKAEKKPEIEWDLLNGYQEVFGTINAHETSVATADLIAWLEPIGGNEAAKDATPQAAPAQTETPVPVVAVGALGEPDKAGPVEDGLLTKEIAVTFDGVNGWNVERWRKNLSASQWLHPARIAIGGAGGASSVWNPLALAQLMHSETKGDKAREQVMKAFNSRFNRNPVLMPWRDAFNEYFATHCTTD